MENKEFGNVANAIGPTQRDLCYVLKPKVSPVLGFLGPTSFLAANSSHQLFPLSALFGSESADAEPHVHGSQTAGCFNGEKKQSESENGSTSEDNKRSPEIEQVQDVDFSTNLDQPTGDVIEEELEYEEGLGSKPVSHSESVERLMTQQRPLEEATGDSNWFKSIFRFKKKEPDVLQVGETSSVPEANRPRGNLSLPGGDMTGSTANTPSKAPAFVQGGAVNSTQVAKSPDTSKVVNNGAAIEDGQKFPPPLTEEPKLQYVSKVDASAAEGKNTSDTGRLTPIEPSRHMNISNNVTSGPDGIRIETILHAEGTHPFEETESSVTTKPDYGVANVTGVVDTGARGDITGPSSSEIDIPPVSSLEEETLGEPLLRPVVEGPVVEGRKLEILKSIVYGGLIESVTSLGVISSAAGSGASMLNILVLGIANLLGGLILIIHNLQELRDEEPRRTTTENNQTNGQEEGRYKRLLGRRDNFTLHASVAILSFIIVGLLPPVVYYFSFNKSYNKHTKDYKVASVFGASLLCIVLLAIAKAHAKTPRGSYLKSALYYTMIAVSVSGISYVVGNFVDQLLEKYGWSDGTETPAGEMMLSLMGRKAGSFGYSSSY
ncbi:unnamed protein product [Arabis nemorensis]|uniref:Membrane protein of ER body-like protein n=1 Tax=Arabis nemorensis TaxID=586526 RepID=A0A565CCF7_9BRAS|nr:unnamed protein product [Arabis nemorensis]